MVQDILKQIKAIWKEMNPVQQISIAIAAALLIFFFVFIIFKSATPYVPLFNEEQVQTDTEEVRAHLERMNIPYKIGTKGLIFVPQDKLQQAHRDIAIFGLSH